MRSLFLAALAGCATAQFSSPSKASSLEVGKQIDIKWNTAGLEAPIAINLVPAGAAQQNVIAQQIAVGMQNTGLLTWAPDLSIAAFPSFNMVIIDSKARVIVSEEFIINSLVQQPAFVTRFVPVVTNVVATNANGAVATQMVTSSRETLLPLPTEPIKLHMSGTQVVDMIVTGVNERLPQPTQAVNQEGQKEGLLPLPGLEGDEKPLQELKPLPSDSASMSESTSPKEVNQSCGNGNAVGAGENNRGANTNMRGDQREGGRSKNNNNQDANNNMRGKQNENGGGRDRDRDRDGGRDRDRDSGRDRQANSGNSRASAKSEGNKNSNQGDRKPMAK